MPLSGVINKHMRHRIAAIQNDNSNGKSRRFKGLAIVRAQTFSSQIIEYAIECNLPSLSSFAQLFCNKITMTLPMSSDIQVPCFLPIDHLHELNSPYKGDSLYGYKLPPSALKLPPNITQPPPQLLTIPPSNGI